MGRHFRTVLVLVLLAATAAAFVVTEDLKLEPDPLALPRVDPTFSPVCRCEQQAARIAFRLRRADSLTLTIADENGRVVRTLLKDAQFRPGNHQFGWDGRDETGRFVPEGSYRPQVELEKLGRQIEFSKQIVVDTTRPSVRVLNVSRRIVSPDRDGRGDAIRIRYRLSEPSHALLVVNGRRVWRTALRAEGVIPWRPGRLRPGLERLQLVAVDAAGNRAAGRPFYIRVRYLEVTPSRLRVRPRRLITVRVSTDYPRYTWRLGRRRSSARAHTLRVRAPATPGRYALTISAGGRRQTTSVLVRRPR
ncbi:MAG TPA: FlgD immunoglobulin-like domain containing protein [Gaiellaceae bacterium]|nr:FlgD immunoglobulin-like domain containing protein [Gaiellaceae bacterium]